MQLEVIRDANRLLQFAPEWSAFAKSQPSVTPFQLPEWLLTWWSHFGSDSPRVFVVRRQECVAVLPCFLHDWKGKRQLTLVGSGISDYLDPLLVASERCAILSCIRDELAATHDWDVCDWQDLASDTPLASLTENTEKHEEVICRELQFAGTFEDYWLELPRHLRRNVRRYGDKARQQGALEFHVAGSADRSLLHALIHLHGARWSARGEPGMIAANHSQEFLFEVAQRFAAQDMLRIFSLLYDGRTAAIILAFVYGGVVYGYLTGFDPTLKQFSLASVLLAESLRECWRQDLRAWNFCRGDETYKADWRGQAIRRCRLVLYPKRS